MKEGALVVISSQGGGTKDTWVLEEEVETPSKAKSKQVEEMVC
jgi:uncharacterized circularly permuted ATP-grasp superfamily protein